jgi:predicted small lipoprotein YifL
VKIPPAAPLLLALVLLSGLTACGKKGALLLPLSNVPSPPTEVTVFQRGRNVTVEWKNPTSYIDGHPLEGLSAVEVWLLRTPLESDKPAPRPPAPQEFGSQAKMLARLPAPPPVAKAPRASSAAAAEGAEAGPESGRGEKTGSGATAAETFVPRYVYTLESDKPAAERLVFGLRAEDSRRKTSAFSTLAVFQPRVLPAPPVGLRAEVKAEEIELSWEAPADNIDGSKPAQVKGYNVYRSLESGPPVRLTETPATETHYADKTFEFGTETVYTVRATEALAEPFGESADSEPLSLKPEDTFPPSAPAGLTALVGPDFISLTWDPVQDKDLAGYRVWRRVKGAEKYEELTTAPIPQTAFEDRQAERARRYDYVVTAEDRWGNRSAYSASVTEGLREGGR